MICPNCQGSVSLRPRMTKAGVEVDHCRICDGRWFDKGEIYLFSKQAHRLAEAIETALQHGTKGIRPSPKTAKIMQEIRLLDGKLVIDYCPDSDGFWMESGEAQTLLKTDPSLLNVSLAAPPAAPSFETHKISTRKMPLRLAPLPNLFLRSVFTITLLYGLLTLVLITLVEFYGLSIDAALGIGVLIVIFQFIFSPWIMDLSLNWLYSLDWVTPETLPTHLRGFIETTCRDQKMEFPRMGIIDDGAPNAFTYGHTPNNARIVITRGLMDLLNEKEVEAVVAHEIGHAQHWDMALMTLVQLVPLVLYYIYRAMIRSASRGSDRNSGGLVVAIGAYTLYIISEYVVLWFSRTREYYADRFAGEVTGRPNDLAAALVKIGYGLAGQETKKDEEDGENEKKDLEAVGALGIFDANVARAFAVSSYNSRTGEGKTLDSLTVKETMRWDMWNPWALYYELHSTHPLVAHRLDQLGRQAQSLGQEPLVVFDLEKPESYWDEFLSDVCVQFLPFAAFLATLAGVAAKIYSTGPASPDVLMDFELVKLSLGVGMTMVGLASLFKLRFMYPRDFYISTKISSLFRKVKVSDVRPIPCKLKGRIIGRGVPGLIWSEDFILQDDTGILFLDYRQPLRFWEFFFGLMHSKDFQDTDVKVTGWYRRAPVPYLELDKLEIGGKIHHCYVYLMKLFTAWAILLGGLATLFYATFMVH